MRPRTRPLLRELPVALAIALAVATTLYAQADEAVFLPLVAKPGTGVAPATATATPSTATPTATVAPSTTTPTPTRTATATTSAGVTTRVSVASDGSQGNGDSYEPSVSADARYVVFDSEATNLVSGDTNGYRDVFVHDRGE